MDKVADLRRCLSLCVDAFDRPNGDAADEEPVAFAFRAYPKNSVPEEVLLKVVVLNQWSNTHLPGGRVLRDVSGRIMRLGLDSRIASRLLDLQLVTDLAKGIGVGFAGRFSFATQYCYWARRTVRPDYPPYPIFDSNAQRAIHRIAKTIDLTDGTGLKQITRSQPWDMRTWTKVQSNLLGALFLEDRWTFRQLDKGLYKLGSVLRYKTDTPDWDRAISELGHQPPAWL